MRQAGAFYQFRHIELQHRLGGYTKTIGQLGSGDLDVRIGAINALERVARDYATERRKVAEVLAAFVRQHASGHCSPPGPGSQEQKRLTRPDVQATISVIGRQLPSETGTLDLTGANLTSADLTRLNLTGANLTGADLTYANLTSAILARANLADAPQTSTARTFATQT